MKYKIQIGYIYNVSISDEKHAKGLSQSFVDAINTENLEDCKKLSKIIFNSPNVIEGVIYIKIKK